MDDDTPTPMEASEAGRRLGSLNKVGPTRNPTAEQIRRDTRILKHFMANTYKVIERLYAMIEDEDTPPGVRLSAISEYLTRSIGKPVQAVDIDVNDRRPIVVDGVLSRLVEELREGTEAGSEGAKRVFKDQE